MRTEDIARHHHAEPFKAFTLHLSDGRSFRVAHRECLAYWPGKRTVVVFAEDGLDALDLMHIVSIDDRAGRNGKSPRRRKSA